jgi:hypothetical protein
MPTRRTWRYVALIITIACTILTLGCGLGGVAVRQGVVAPPNVNVELGSMRVIGISSISPECTRLIIPGCIGLDPVNAPRIYTLWLFQQSERDSWSQPHITQLLSLRMERPQQ